MKRRIRSGAVCALLALGLACASTPGTAGLDWEVQESSDPALPVAVARNVRDGVLTFGDAFVDVGTSLFGALALGVSQVTMLVADTVGLVDDNPVTQHVTRGIVSTNLAKVAYLWHVAGAESVLSGHGQDAERWAATEVAGLNPLLSDEDVDEIAPPIPLDPLDFVGEGMLHDRVYRPQVVLYNAGAAVLVDGVMRPTAGVLRIIQLRGAGDAVEERGNALYRKAARAGW